MEEGWRRDGGGMEEGWRRDGRIMDEGCGRSRMTMGHSGNTTNGM